MAPNPCACHSLKLTPHSTYSRNRRQTKCLSQLPNPSSSSPIPSWAGPGTPSLAPELSGSHRVFAVSRVQVLPGITPQEPLALPDRRLAAPRRRRAPAAFAPFPEGSGRPALGNLGAPRPAPPVRRPATAADPHLRCLSPLWAAIKLAGAAGGKREAARAPPRPPSLSPSGSASRSPHGAACSAPEKVECSRLRLCASFMVEKSLLIRTLASSVTAIVSCVSNHAACHPSSSPPLPHPL